MSKVVECPHCGERINLSKVGRKRKSADFIDAQGQEQIRAVLQRKNIELGKVVEDDSG